MTFLLALSVFGGTPIFDFLEALVEPGRVRAGRAPLSLEGVRASVVDGDVAPAAQALASQRAPSPAASAHVLGVRDEGAQKLLYILADTRARALDRQWARPDIVLHRLVCARGVEAIWRRSQHLGVGPLLQVRGRFLTGAAMPKAERSRVTSYDVALYSKSMFVEFCEKRTVAEKT
jgi:hypothetical protein